VKPFGEFVDGNLARGVTPPSGRIVRPCTAAQSCASSRGSASCGSSSVTRGAQECPGVTRAFLRWQSIPVILVTAYPEDAGIAHAAELGATDVFRKGNLDLEELRAAVEQKLWPRIVPEQWGQSPSLQA
jgi:hypothetical protein